jgi:mannosyl-oligosaccharide alpha-1,2-mannosidase
LEFTYLADATGKMVYKDKLDRIRQVVSKLDRTDGLYPNYLNPKTGRWGQQHVSMGALGDSFYEYLLKNWLQSGKADEESRLMYVDAMENAIQKLIQTSKGGLTYFAEMKFGRLEHKMDHLACFTG